MKSAGIVAEILKRRYVLEDTVVDEGIILIYVNPSLGNVSEVMTGTSIPR
jgi:hypothetical protein